MAQNATRTENAADPRCDLLAGLIGHRLRIANLAAVGCFEAEFRDLALTPIQFCVLELVASGEQLAQADLAGRICTAPSVLVSSIGKLETRGLVRRERQDDRRRYGLTLTRTGSDVLGLARTAIRRAEARLHEVLSPAEVTVLLGLLGRIASLLDHDPHPSSEAAKPRRPYTVPLIR